MRRFEWMSCLQVFPMIAGLAVSWGIGLRVCWNEVAKYAAASPESVRIMSELMNRYPDRFLFGVEEVAPATQEKYLMIYN